ncbi:hypothetical protein H0H93_014191 [Arthromyces matolae]|nr:hypothetical protein H0H93_014191 [Arthromyces matolae]
MSFQNFRLGEALHQLPIPSHLPPSTSSFSATSTPQKQPGSNKQPYGSGDADDGYTLVFPNLAAFQEWRQQEEDRQMVEFVKGDTHGSKAVPPRFKDHTKLVCARHSRSGRKKYVKKHPERVRKVPSRKLDGVGCPASISYKTYFDTDEVRACSSNGLDSSHHSHEIGPANLPFTRKGRKAAAQVAKEQRPEAPTGDLSAHTTPAPASGSNPAATHSSSVPPPQAVNSYTASVSMIAPLPNQHPAAQYVAPPFSYHAAAAPPPPVQPAMSLDRWENMATLFNSVREHARVFEYPSVSVAALETILIRLYLESPVSLNAQPSIASVVQETKGRADDAQMQRPPGRCNEGNSSDESDDESSG